MGKATEAVKALAGNSTCNTQPGAPPQPCGWRSTGRRRGVPWQLQLRLQPGPWSSLHHLRDRDCYRLDDGVLFIHGPHEDLHALSSLTVSLPLFQQQNLLSFCTKKPGSILKAPSRPCSAAGCRRLLSSRLRYPLTLTTAGGTPPPKAHGDLPLTRPPVPEEGRGHTRCTGAGSGPAKAGEPQAAPRPWWPPCAPGLPPPRPHLRPPRGR